jgi:hypothetical protein
MSTGQLLTTAGSAVVLWLVKRRFVNSIRNPLTRTVVSIVDRTAVGMPVVLLVATADLALTTANGVIQSLLAGGYVLKIVSYGVVDVCADALRKREEAHQQNSLLDSWVRLDASADAELVDSFDGVGDFTVLSAPTLQEQAARDHDDAATVSLELETLEAVRASLLADPAASVCIVPVSDAAGDATLPQPPELALSREDAARVLELMVSKRRNALSDAALSMPLSMTSSSVLFVSPKTTTTTTTASSS